MLNRQQLKKYRELRGLSTRDVAAYCNLSQPMIVQVENGTKDITQNNHNEIVKGINKAYEAKKNGTFVKPPHINQSKTKVTKETIKTVTTPKKRKEKANGNKN